MLNVWTQENPHLATCSCWEEEQFHGRVKSNLPWPWRLNLWHTLRPRFKHYVKIYCENFVVVFLFKNDKRESFIEHIGTDDNRSIN